MFRNFLTQKCGTQAKPLAEAHRRTPKSVPLCDFISPCVRIALYTALPTGNNTVYAKLVRSGDLVIGAVLGLRPSVPTGGTPSALREII